MRDFGVVEKGLCGVFDELRGEIVIFQALFCANFYLGVYRG